MQQRASHASNVGKLARHFVNAPERGPQFVDESVRENTSDESVSSLQKVSFYVFPGAALFGTRLVVRDALPEDVAMPVGTGTCDSFAAIRSQSDWT
jgi:CelD/BcsL family acetyltransferase involved in cellulose biosynthesis